jgi:rSAM/selenodomain-associated transferase 2
MAPPNEAAGAPGAPVRRERSGPSSGPATTESNLRDTPRRHRPTISVVIPTLNEAATIAGCVAGCRPVADEIIVADGGSTDETRALARSAGATLIESELGRGAQLNAGASVARGDVLLFVHADVHLPAEAGAAVRGAVERGYSGGNFKLRFVPQTPVANFYAAGNHLRRRALRLYYGDSCIFVQRTVFDSLGGFANLPLFEDHEFVRRLEKATRTHYETEVVVSASSRRFAKQPLRTLALWASLQALYAIGVPARQLANFYAHVR